MQCLTAHPVVGVGAIILRGDGSILLGHRTKKGEAASWSLPGGHVEPKETFEAAAIREIAEETGLRAIAAPQVFAVLINMNADSSHMTAGVLARATSEDETALVLEPAVFSSWIWAKPSALPGSLFPASAALIAAWRGEAPLPGWIGYPIALKERNGIGRK